MQPIYKRYFKIYSAPILAFLFLAISMWNLNLLFLTFPIFISFLLYSIFTKEIIIRLKTIDIVFLILVFSQIVLLAISSYKFNSVSYQNTTLCMAGFYFLLRLFGMRGKTRTKIFLIIVASWGIFLAILTFFSFIFFRFNIQYEGFTNVLDFRSLYLPLGKYSNDWTSYLILFLTLTTAIYLSSKNVYLKVVSGIGSVLIALCLVISFSRGAYIALFTFIFILSSILVFWKLSWDKSKLKLLALIGFIILVSIPYKTDVKTTLGMNKTASHQRSNSGRVVLWKGALKMFADNPIQGVGAGNFGNNISRYTEKQADSIFTSRVTNSYLQLLAEQGIIGLITWGFLIMFILISMLSYITNKNKTSQDRLFCLVLLSGLIAFGVRELTFSSFFGEIGLQLLFTITAAYAAINAKNIFVLRKKSILAAVTIAILAIYLLAVLSYLLNNFAKTKNAHFITNFRKGELHLASKEINKAIKLKPANALLYFNRALLSDTILSKKELFSNQLSQNEVIAINSAISDLKKAISLTPNETIFKHNLAILYGSIGKHNLCEKELKEVLILDPYSDIYNTTYALFLKSQKRNSEASKYLLKAIELSPEILSSKIWTTFLSHDSSLQQKLKDSVAYMQHETSPIIKARYARILLYYGDSIKAKELLFEATKALPNMNRPWLYLGEIALCEGDTVHFKNNLNRSILFDGSDFLPQLVMAKFSRETNNISDAIYYYRQCLMNYSNLYSIHSVKTIYTHQTKTIYNNILPSSLLPQMKTDINLIEIAKSLRQLYIKSNLPEKAKEFNKYINRLQTLPTTLKNTKAAF